MRRILFALLMIAGAAFAPDSFTFHCSTSINGKQDKKYKHIRRVRVKRCEKNPGARTVVVISNAHIDILVVHANCKVKLHHAHVGKIFFVPKDGMRRGKVVISNPKTHNVDHFEGKGILVRKYITRT